MSEVSIAILNWKGKEDTFECIQSIYKSSYKDFEIVIIDNNSEDGSVEFLKRKFPFSNFQNLKIIENDYNAGLAGGFNIGLEHCKGEFVVLLGNDTIVDEHWLEELVKEIKSDEKIAIAGSRIKNLVGYSGEETSGATLNVLFQVALKEKESNETTLASLTSLILRKKLFEDAPFIDEYFGNHEDVQLSILARLKGYKVTVTPKSFLIHKGGASVSKVPTLMSFHMDKNVILDFLILYQVSTILKLLPLFVIMHLSIIVNSFFTKHFFAKLKAYVWIIKNWRIIPKYRKVINRQRKISDKDLLKSAFTYKLPLSGRFGKILNSIVKAYLYIVGLRTKDM